MGTNITWYFEASHVVAKNDEGTVLARIFAEEHLGPGMVLALNGFPPISDLMLRFHAVAVNDAPS